MAALLLVRYGELALKSAPVRREFEATLRRNIVQQFLHAGLALQLRSDRGHLYAEVDDPEEGCRILRRVFGVTSVSVAHEVPTERGALRAALLELASPRLSPGVSFAVRARRTGTHDFTSQELARDLGSDVLEAFPDRRLHVDLRTPTVELFVEVRGPRTYLYFDRTRGPGGLPLGVAGRLVALVDGERGALGAYLMMKRGCRVALLRPPAAAPLVDGLLRRFDPGVRIQELAEVPESWSAALGAAVASLHADGVVLPLAVEQYPDARATWGEVVVFSPTVGLGDDEVGARWSEIADLAGAPDAVAAGPGQRQG
ncbi:MAG TPA: THUMP domain-containing protein [Thermoplasmata archaeon]|nr:THUMP domain-containing protein [Thermoplasmata archaeon]